MRSFSRHSYCSVSELPFLFVDSEGTSSSSSAVSVRTQQQFVVHSLDTLDDDWEVTESAPGSRTS